MARRGKKSRTTKATKKGRAKRRPEPEAEGPVAEGEDPVVERDEPTGQAISDAPADPTDEEITIESDEPTVAVTTAESDDARDEETSAEPDDAPDQADAPDDDDEDVGPASTPEARARLLAEALAHAEMQEARYRVPMGTRQLARIKGGVALSIFFVAGVVALAPPDFVVPERPHTVASDELETGVVSALLLQAQQIDAFRVREERLPSSLEELSSRVSGIRYVRSSSRLYQLVAYTSDGRTVVYDSAAPAQVFRDVVPAWRRAGP